MESTLNAVRPDGYAESLTPSDQAKAPTHASKSARDEGEGSWCLEHAGKSGMTTDAQFRPPLPRQ